MYNGIGLPTPRGSGTSGYVQKNLAHVRKNRLLKQEIISDKHLDEPKNFELLTHEKKRQIEAKCLNLRIIMEQEGRSESRIEREVNEYRRRKLKELSRMTENDHTDHLKESFGISKEYVDGSAVTQIKKINDKKLDEAKKEEVKLEEELDVKPVIKIKTELKTEEDSKSNRDRKHRSGRDRERERDKERERERDKERERGKDREKHRHSHRHRHKDSRSKREKEKRYSSRSRSRSRD